MPFSSPGDCPDLGVEPWVQGSINASSALAGRFFTTETPEKPKSIILQCNSKSAMGRGQGGREGLTRWKDDGRPFPVTLFSKGFTKTFWF